MPTSAQQTFSLNRLVPTIRPEKAIEIDVALAEGTYAAGTLLGEVTATPGTYAAYTHGNSDGTETAKAILQYGCVVDSGGNIDLGNEFGIVKRTAPVYVGGGAIYRVADLTGLDSYAVPQLGASFVQGDSSGGLLRY